MRFRRAGFTLIEVLLAMAIAAALLGALAASLAGSFRVVQVLDSRKKAVFENALIAVERVSKDIQQSSVYPSIAFKGGPTRVSFPQASEQAEELDLNYEFKLGQVRQMTLGQASAFHEIEYSFDASSGALTRRAGTGEPAVVLENADSVKFSYAVRSVGGEFLGWKESTPDPGASEFLCGMTIRVGFDAAKHAASVPGAEKTFLFLRKHPVSAVEMVGSKE